MPEQFLRMVKNVLVYNKKNILYKKKNQNNYCIYDLRWFNQIYYQYILVYIWFFLIIKKFAVILVN